ncbi:hypothetical protein JCM6882_003032 [Rhodosporidiobolus microsporus]
MGCSQSTPDDEMETRRQEEQYPPLQRFWGPQPPRPPQEFDLPSPDSPHSPVLWPVRPLEAEQQQISQPAPPSQFAQEHAPPSPASPNGHIAPGQYAAPPQAPPSTGPPPAYGEGEGRKEAAQQWQAEAEQRRVRVASP